MRMLTTFLPPTGLNPPAAVCRWFACHRWLLTGTPVRGSVDNIAPSLEFLHFGNYNTAFKHVPATLAHVLTSSMVRCLDDSMDDDPGAWLCCFHPAATDLCCCL